MARGTRIAPGRANIKMPSPDGVGMFTRVAVCCRCGASLSVPLTLTSVQCASCSCVVDVGPAATQDDEGWISPPTLTVAEQAQRRQNHSAEDGEDDDRPPAFEDSDFSMEMSLDLTLLELTQIPGVDVSSHRKQKRHRGRGPGRESESELSSGGSRGGRGGKRNSVKRANGGGRRGSGHAAAERDSAVNRGERRVTFDSLPPRPDRDSAGVGLTEMEARMALRRYIRSTKMRKRNFADEMHVETIERVGAFAVFLENALEFRKVTQRTRPAMQEMHGIPFEAGTSAWSVDIPGPPPFQSYHELVVPLDIPLTPGAQSACMMCQGSGTSMCAWCDGEGIDYELHNPCPYCSQTGMVQCGTCDGSGTTSPGADLVAMWQTPRFERAFVPDTDAALARKLPIDQLIMLSLWSPPLYSIQRKRKLKLSDLAEDLPEAMKAVIADALEVTPLMIPENGRLLGQRLVVRPMPIYRVIYSPNREFYVFGGGRGSMALSTANSGARGQSAMASEIATRPTRARAWYGVVAPSLPIDKPRLITLLVCIGLIITLIVVSFLVT